MAERNNLNYTKMEKHQEIMLAELKDLSDKIDKLNALWGTDTYKNLDMHRRMLLTLQRNAMEQYAVILACRCIAEGISIGDIITL